jgi:hypothetical protein
MAVLRTSKDVSHLGRVPVGSTGTSRNSTTGQTVGDGLKGGGTGGLNLPDHTDHRVVESLSGLTVGSNHQGRSVVGISTSTKTNPSGLRSGECGLGSFRDQLTFTLCYQGQNSHGESVHVGAVATDEVDSGVLETKQELSVSAETIEFSNHQGGLGPFALIKSGVELRSVVEATAFDLREFLKDLTFLAEDESRDGIPLGVHTVSVMSLVSCGDSEVGDVMRHMQAATSGAQAIKLHLKELNDR